MESNRRNFLKSTLLTLGVAPLVGKVLGLNNEALASGTSKAEHDSMVKLQGYSKSGKPDKKSQKKYDDHVKKLKEAYEKEKKDMGSAVPQCLNCKHYKPQKDKEGWGKCSMVGATGKPGKYVRDAGWCKVWAVNKKKLS